MASFTPDPEALQQVLAMLTAALAPDSALQRQAHEAMQRHSSSPLFALYLAYVFVRGGSTALGVRHIAGLTLKAAVDREGYVAALAPAAQQQLRQELLQGLLEESEPLRRAAANCITAVVRRAGLAAWPALPQLLAGALDSDSPSAQIGALEALHMLAEDTAAAWADVDTGGEEGTPRARLTPLALVQPRLFRWMQAPSERARLLAARAMMHFSDGADLGDEAAREYLRLLSALTQDRGAAMKSVLIASIAHLVRSSWQVALPSATAIVSFVAAAIDDESDDVAKAACDFWDSYVGAAIAVDQAEADARQRVGAPEPHWLGQNQAVLWPHLAVIVPSLLRRMRLAQEDLSAIPAADQSDDAAAADRSEDVRPHVRADKAAAGSPSVDLDSDEDESESFKGDSNGDDGNEGGKSDRSDPHAEVRTHTLRQSAARALEDLSDCYEDRVAEVLMPELQRLLQAGAADVRRWEEREHAALVLGTVFQGCSQAFGPHMPMLFGVLLSFLGDPAPLVRCMAAWALGRYSGWVLEMEVDAQANEGDAYDCRYLGAVVQGLCGCLRGANRRMQQAACMALYCAATEANISAARYAPAVLATACEVLPVYQLRSRLALYDMLGKCAEEGVFDDLLGGANAAAAAARCQQVLQLLVPRLLRLRADDPELPPLFESISFLARPMGSHFAPACPAIFARCVELLQLDLVLALAAADARERAPDLGRADLALDVLDSVFDAAGSAAADLLASAAGQVNVAELVLRALELPYDDLRCSSFVLVGNMSDHAWAHVQPFAGPLVAACVDTVRRFSLQGPTVKLAACNNAVWALGRMALRLGSALGDSVTPECDHLVKVLERRGGVNETLAQNVATTLGVLAEHCGAARVVATQQPWPSWAERWLHAAASCREPAERAQALMGFCHAIAAAPQPVARLLPVIASAFVVSKGAPPALRQAMAGVIRLLRGVVGEATWSVQAAAWPQVLREGLTAELGVDLQ